MFVHCKFNGKRLFTIFANKYVFVIFFENWDVMNFSAVFGVCLAVLQVGFEPVVSSVDWKKNAFYLLLQMNGPLLSNCNVVSSL